LVIVNAKVWTGVKPSSPEPNAIAVAGDTIVAVGTDAQVRSRVGDKTIIIDAQGRRVIPGITDSHTHIVSGGFQLARLTLRDVRSREEFVQAVQAEVRKKNKGEWIVGGRWSVESWDKPEPPNKAWLDPISPDNPVFLSRMDGHQALVNSEALKLAGIDAQGPPDSVGGEIERDPITREPTGVLKESAMDLLDRFIPEPTRADRREALLRALKHANSFGVTSVHDMSQLADLEIFRQASEQNTLTVRITSYLSVEDWSARFADAVQAKELWTAPMFRLAGFKGFMDGSLGSRTAYMREPYADATTTTLHPRGQLTAFASSQTFRPLVAQADAKDLQMAVHAIGDEGIHLLLDAYEAAARQNDSTDRRHRVEHTQHLLVSDIPRFAKLGVVASMQPFHKADDGRYAEKAIGAERLRGSYAFRQLVDAKALVVFGSDWPVVTLNPFAGIDSAVNAKTLSGEVWLPAHSLTVEEALRAYTVSPPKAIHQELRLGTLEAGKLADFVILVDDPFTMPRERLAEVKVAQTIVGGKVVYP
jgi:predicted amidohydrolase YtcJ